MQTVAMGSSVENACPRPMLDRVRKTVIDWNLEDSKGKPLPVVRGIRNEIERWVEELAAQARAWCSRVNWMRAAVLALDCAHERTEHGRIEIP